jgi:hypothetical protein
VAPSRFPGWVADFAERHGDTTRGAALTVVLAGGEGGLGERAVTPGENVIYTAPDGAVAECHPPFPPVAGLAAHASPSEPDSAVGAAPTGLAAAACAEAVAGHAMAPRTVGVLLVRLGGYAAGVFTGSPPRLAASKTGSRLVHGRSAAGGWSQHRFARRREKQANEALQAAADAAVTVFARWEEGASDNSNKREGDAPVRSGYRERAAGAGAVSEGGRGLDAVVLGGDKRAVAELRADPRLLSYFELATDRFLTVPDPKLTVLKDAPRHYLAVRIWLTEPGT